jgi:starvation-inducible DNA-binding protein
MNAPMATKKQSSAPSLAPTRNDLSLNARAALVQLLGPRLAEALDLYMRLKEAHWNVKGPQFAELHRLFDEVASDAARVLRRHRGAHRAARRARLGVGARRRRALGAAPAVEPLQGWESLTGHVADVLAVFGKAVRAGSTWRRGSGMRTPRISSPRSRAAVDKWLWQVEAHVQK